MNICNICQSEHVENLTQLTYKGLVGMDYLWTAEASICKSCGFVFWNNPMSEEVLASRYRELSKYEFIDNALRESDNQDYVTRSKHQINLIDLLTENKTPIKSVLEVGAASGYNLSLYKQKGLKCLGIEPSLYNCQNAQKCYGVEMFNGVLTDFIAQNPKENIFDLIILSHVLEHIANPANVIDQLSKINHQYIFIEVPTHDCCLQEEPYGYFCEEHVNYFTLESLQVLMNRFAYELVSSHLVYDAFIRLPAGNPKFSTLWKKTDHSPHALPAVRPDHQTISEMKIRQYLDYSDKAFAKVKKRIDAIADTTRLAVWGTGHHTSLLLGQTSLEHKNIVTYYDSDPKKQLLTMLGKEIRPFDPIHCKDSVDAILISSYVFQKPIRALIESYADLQVEVITLY